MSTEQSRLLTGPIRETWSFMPAKLPPNDGRAFISGPEAMHGENETDFIEANMPTLERFVRQYQHRIYDLVKLQQRARGIRGRHEPPAEKRASR